MTHKSLHHDKHTRVQLHKSYIAEAISAAILATVISAPVLSQNNDDVIIVTATKSNQSIQEVPLAITAMTGEFMSEVHLTDVKDLVSYTPGITGNSHDSFIDAISVRGIRTQDFGVGGDPSTAFFKNDLYEGRNGSAVSTLYDMDRAEILRGPQGFLFGRNSIAGAISVHTRKAEIDNSSGFIDLDIGEFNHVEVSGAQNIDVNGNFAMRIAGIYSAEDGYVINNFDGGDLGGADKTAIRWSTTYKADDLAVYTMVEYEDRKLSGSLYRAIETGDIWDTFDAAFGGVNIAGGSEGINSDQSPGEYDNSKVLNLGLKIEYDLGFADLTASTGYKDHDYYYSEDYDGTPLNTNNYQQDQTGDYFQQEVRLNFKKNGPLSWYVGASYYKENIDTNFRFIASEDSMCQYYGYANNSGMTFNGCADLYAYYDSSFTPSADGNLTETNHIIGKYSGWATYVNMDYELSDTLDIELGIRHTSDKKQFSNYMPTPESDLGTYWAYGFSTAEPLTDTKTWTDTSYRVLARWKPADDMMFYTSYTQGYKSGGFGSFNLGPNANGDYIEWGTTDLTNADGFPVNSFEPELVDSYEVGYKDIWFDGNSKVDLTAFYYEYQDLQVVVTTETGAGSVKNVGQAEASGIEGSIKSRLSDNFNLYLGMSYLNSEATKLQDICGIDGDPNGCEGSSLYWAPDFSGAMVIDGDFPLDDGASITTSIEMTWESERGGGWENLSSTKIDSYQEMAMRLGYQSAGDWTIEAYVENLTDVFTWDGENNNGYIVPSHFFGPKKPRTFGVRMRMSWD